jgi:hypothetical protein
MLRVDVSAIATAEVVPWDNDDRPSGMADKVHLIA